MTTNQRGLADGAIAMTAVTGGAATERCDQEPVWAVVLPRLWRYARSRGLTPDDAHDAVQEAITRALAKSVPYTGPEDLLRWCQRVVTNLSIDSARRRRWLTDEPGPDAPDAHDALAGLEARILLEQVASELQRLPVAQRNAILDHASGSAPLAGRQEQNRQAKARERGRVALRRALGGPFAVAAFVAGALRKLARDSTVPTAASAGVVVVVALAVAVHGQSHGDKDPTPRRPGTALSPLVATPATMAPVAPGARSTPSPRPLSAPPRVPAPQSTTLVEEQAPLGVRAGAEKRRSTADDHVICLGGGPVPAPVCLI